jgi:hypothetical protein
MRGRAVRVAGLDCRSWHDDPRLRVRIPQDGARRSPLAWVRQIILHTTLGIPGGKNQTPQSVRFGVGRPSDVAANVAQWWSTSEASAGAHIIVEFDGRVACLADLADEITYHAGTCNGTSIGIEIAQANDGSLYAGQLECVVRLVDFLTLTFGIQRQIHAPYKGPIARLVRGGADCVGVFGHRDQTASRGLGDPGDAVFGYLLEAGYEAFDFGRGEDVAVWRERQANMPAPSDAPDQLRWAVDGIPGPRTVARIRGMEGRACGLWVPRPGDGRDVAAVAAGTPVG